jgi:hypothetical protein
MIIKTDQPLQLVNYNFINLRIAHFDMIKQWMQVLATVMFMLLLNSCNFGTDSDAQTTELSPDSPVVVYETQGDVISLPLSEAANGMKFIEPQDLGTLIGTIDFQLKATREERKTFEDGIVPWISIDKPAAEVGRLVDADKIIVPYSKPVLIIEYPVKAPVFFQLTGNEEGFTRQQLITVISEKYHAMYSEEEQTASVKTKPAGERDSLINRNDTNGKYGIWGHDLSDLDLRSVEIYKNKNGKIYLSLVIES